MKRTQSKTGLFNLFLLIFISVSGLHANHPERIISLAPSLTKNLMLLEADSKLVGCTNYCPVDGEHNATVVANAVQVNIEKIFLLQPDLILSTSLTPSKSIEKLRKLGLNVLVYENPVDFQMICDQFIHLGSQLGKEKKAKMIISSAMDRVELVQKKINTDILENPRIFMQLGAKPLFTVVPGTFMNDYMTMANTQNIANDLLIGSINLESVLVRDPQVIVIVLMGMVASEEREKWEEFDQLSAVKNNRIYVLDADKACSPTPLSFVESLEELIKMIYRDK